jgi:uncharacterized OB-fold protein
MSSLPVPRPNADSSPYWEAARREVLCFQYCPQCHKAQFPPRAHCLACQGAVVWKASSGEGQIHSFTVVERAPSAAFKALVPYTIVLVDMAEGFRLMLNLRGEEPQAASIGARVKVIFEPTADGGLKLPQAILC